MLLLNLLELDVPDLEIYLGDVPGVLEDVPGILEDVPGVLEVVRLQVLVDHVKVGFITV